MSAPCQVLELGEIDYPTARGLQSTIAAERAAGVRTDCLLLLMHPHTYTLGSAAIREHLLLSDRQLRARGIAVHVVARLPITDPGNLLATRCLH